MTLSKQQKRIYDNLRAAGLGVNVSITTIYFVMRVKGTVEVTTRRKQQAVGSIISRLNKQLRPEGYEIVPGELKRTYKLTQYVAS